jgi:hypothetical protein
VENSIQLTKNSTKFGPFAAIKHLIAKDSKIYIASEVPDSKNLVLDSLALTNLKSFDQVSIGLCQK